MKELVIIIFVLLCIPQIASANIIVFNDRNIFESFGTISENYGFEDFSAQEFDGEYFWNLPRNWTSHGVTYYGLGNLIMCPPSGTLRLNSNVFMSNYPTNISAFIDRFSQYTLLGMDLGYGNIDPGDYNSINLLLSTNISDSNYIFYDLALSRSPKMSFWGFILDDVNEFFTKVTICPQGRPTSYRTLIDNVTLGHYVDSEINSGFSAIPEPATFLLFSMSMFTMFFRKFLIQKKKRLI
ncbi:hypothetical protein [Desulfovulcanus sp.]